MRLKQTDVMTALEAEISRQRRHASPVLQRLDPAAQAEWWRASLLHWARSLSPDADEQELVLGLIAALGDFNAAEMQAFVSAPPPVEQRQTSVHPRARRVRPMSARASDGEASLVNPLSEMC